MNCCSGNLLNQLVRQRWQFSEALAINPKMRLRMPACCPGSFPGVPDSFCGDESPEEEEEGGANVELLSPEGVRGIGGLLPDARTEGYKEGFAKIISRKRM
jgi:hypothetical protein